MVARVTQDEVKRALKKMKRGKALGPDNIPIEAWISLEEAGVGYLTSLFNKILAEERMPDKWRKSTLIPIYKNKGDAQDCVQRQLDCVFIDLEKAYDRVPREELWHYMRESSIVEVDKYVLKVGVGLHQGSA
ncbi:uncharacterized protein LOC122253579 [Penaeus japonicus]|uniref:uncharacterized protein LOC122253579 n=1 Tax=Penaeus japonicus TaxID=27405 RepID=UPI001C716284|nr:uncharacterized protein LOC122253579 [Penaeus japonicus]